MNIDKEIVMITKSKFQDISEELNRNYYKDNNYTELQTKSYNSKLNALKDALDKLLVLLDKAVS